MRHISGIGEHILCVRDRAREKAVRPIPKQLVHEVGLARLAHEPRLLCPRRQFVEAVRKIAQSIGIHAGLVFQQVVQAFGRALRLQKLLERIAGAAELGTQAHDLFECRIHDHLAAHDGFAKSREFGAIFDPALQLERLGGSGHVIGGFEHHRRGCAHCIIMLHQVAGGSFGILEQL